MRHLRFNGRVAQHTTEDLRPSDSVVRGSEGLDSAENRRRASWLRQVEIYLKDMGMGMGLAYAWAIARRRSGEYRRRLDVATRCSGVSPHTGPEYAILKLEQHQQVILTF